MLQVLFVLPWFLVYLVAHQFVESRIDGLWFIAAIYALWFPLIVTWYPVMMPCWYRAY